MHCIRQMLKLCQLQLSTIIHIAILHYRCGCVLSEDSCTMIGSTINLMQTVFFLLWDGWILFCVINAYMEITYCSDFLQHNLTVICDSEVAILAENSADDDKNCLSHCFKFHDSNNGHTYMSIVYKHLLWYFLFPWHVSTVRTTK